MDHTTPDGFRKGTAKTSAKARQARHHDRTVNDFLNAEVELLEAQRVMQDAKREAIKFCLEHQLDCFTLDVKKFKRLNHVGGQ